MKFVNRDMYIDDNHYNRVILHIYIIIYITITISITINRPVHFFDLLSDAIYVIEITGC